LSFNVLFVSAEVAPFAKVGGLADVAGSLPKALRRLGVDVRVVMPLYGFIDQPRYSIQPAFHFDFARQSGTHGVDVFHTVYDGVPVYFLRSLPFFGNENAVYSDWDWDSPRFIFLCQMTMAFADALREREGWSPDVVHVNDWHTALIPFLIEQRRDEPAWATTGHMLSIHNLAYQGDNVTHFLMQEHIPPRQHPDLLSRGLENNLLAIAIAYSDIVSTVSPRYAIEIQYPYMGYGLDDLVRTRVNDLYGILNGIDVETMNPETDPLLVANYNADNFAERRILNKRQLQADSGLEVRDDVPVIGIVSRLVWQKGIDLALPALRRLLLDTDVQLVALGSGDPDLQHQMWRLGQDFHWRASVFIGYNATVAQRIYAGSDLFLMPSRYEPCGVGQMLAMRYGSLPVVRETGGLADTVQNYDNGPADRGTGFTFEWEEPQAVLGTLRWALETYWERPEAWRRMQHRAMTTDLSWDKSARQYVDLYRQIIEKRKGQPL